MPATARELSELGLLYQRSANTTSQALSNPSIELTPPTTVVTPLRGAAGGQVFAEAARRAGRMNALRVSEREHQTLLAERQYLLDKTYAGTITRKECGRLKYVIWNLDRIDDAKYGDSLGVLELKVAQFEKLLDGIDNLRGDIGVAIDRGLKK